MKIRELDINDYDKGFCKILNQLSRCSIGREKFVEVMLLRSKYHFDSAYTFIAEDDDGTLLGTASLYLEQKFSYGGAMVGRIEDVVIDEKVRQKGTGKALVLHLA